MKKTTATTALAATVGLSAWTMAAALAVAPAPAEAPSGPALEVTPGPSVDGIGQGDDGAGPGGDGERPVWADEFDKLDSCADVVGTRYVDVVLPYGFPSFLDVDGDGVMCESNGDDDRTDRPDLWENGVPPYPVGYVFPNCDTAYHYGPPYPFPVEGPFSGSHLDPDGDGVACESNGDDDAAFTGVIETIPLVTHAPAPAPAPVPAPAPAPAPAPTGQVASAEAPAAEAPAAPAPAAQAPAAAAPAAQTPAAEAPAAAHPAAAGAPAAEGSQVKQVPVGGADTGVPESQNRAGLLVGGGALTALAGLGLLIRRAHQH